MPLNMLRGYGSQPGRHARVREGNDCNLPEGESDGGQFGRNDDPRCAGGAGASDRIVLSPTGRMAGHGKPSTSQLAAQAAERTETPLQREMARLRRENHGAEPHRGTIVGNMEWNTRQALFRNLLINRGVDLDAVPPEDVNLMGSQAAMNGGDTEFEKAYTQAVTGQPATPSARTPRPATEPPKLTSQDSKASSTKQTTFDATDNVKGTLLGTKGDTIFGPGVPNTLIAEEMVKYITEEMSVAVNGFAEDTPDTVDPGPDPQADETRAAYQEAMEVKSAHMARKHEEDAKLAFDTYAYESFKGLGAVVRGAMIDSVKYHLENPELTPQEADPRQLSFDLDEDPSTTDFERQRHLLTPEKVIEILDTHNLLTRTPGATNSEFSGESAGIASRIESELANGGFSEQFASQDVLSALFDASHEDYDEPAVAAARAELRALRPTDEAFADKGRENRDAYKEMVNDGVLNAFAGQEFMHPYLTQDEPRNALSERWYKESGQGQNAPMNHTSFSDWYGEKFGHEASDWEQITAAKAAGPNFNAPPKDGEQRFDFSGENGSTVTRKFTREYGRLSVYHSYFTNHGPAGQGKGLMRGQMELYEKLGVTEITTTANISTGSYAWARYGFRAESPESLAYDVTNRLDSILSSAPALRRLRADIESVIDDNRDDASLPWHVSDLRITGTPAEMREIARRFTVDRLDYLGLDPHDAERWDDTIRADAEKGVLNIGKLLMVGHNWDARFDMHSQSQRARMRDYIGDWTKPADGSGALKPQAPTPPAKSRAGRVIRDPADVPVGTMVTRQTNRGAVTAKVSTLNNDAPYFRYAQDVQQATDKVGSGWAPGSQWRKKKPKVF